jgi:DNA-binding NarL/FixJ family response regulator
MYGRDLERKAVPIQILLADDHTLFREMLAEVLSHKGHNYKIVGEAVDGEETLRLVDRHHPDLLLLDYDMSLVGRLSSFCQAVTQRSPTTRTLIVSGYAKEEIALEAGVGGARGYILKGAPIANLLNAIATVQAGGVWVDPHLPPHMFRVFLSQTGKTATHLGQLSRRELQVLALVAQGLSNKQIGTRLYISQKTVKNHLSHIFTKLGVTNRRQAALAFLTEGKKSNTTPES